MFKTFSSSKLRTIPPLFVALTTPEVSSKTSSIELTRPIWSIATLVTTPTSGFIAEDMINAWFFIRSVPQP